MIHQRRLLNSFLSLPLSDEYMLQLSTIAFMSEQTRMKRLKHRENCIFVHEWQKLIDKRSEWKTLSISCQNHFKWLIFVNRYLFVLILFLNFTPLIFDGLLRTGQSSSLRFNLLFFKLLKISFKFVKRNLLVRAHVIINQP